ncbi:uncharacterized protein LOC143459353 [Clavelina lepadiformis]|uniref:Uncharacterized protein n=1 Tax=Clavelina lepadiformis TaxID=159417 RepID=A0ABP0FVT3_CLALP
MALEGVPTESSAMARARELNRTNEKRLTETISMMSQEVERSLQKLKLDEQSTIKFMKKLKISSGKSKVSIEPQSEENEDIESLIKPLPKMTFSKIDYKKKKLEESSHRLITPDVPLAAEGNPIAVRKVHAWTASTARALSQKKPPQIPRPTGRRRHSLDSDNDSSDDDDISPLRKVKKRAGQKRLKEIAKRRSSLPIIKENKQSEKLVGAKEKVTKKSIQQSLVRLKETNRILGKHTNLI